ncbi:amidase [Thermopolyspora flexuosa]|uniref:Amidase n=1 Tax=Thermopolyspora flexuosa TaxID=103836 RepID=A0A543IWE3_9ACTN|nr:amidase [Thermopolyspora flexuosa]TQM74890.1 amidase [Thermopolyspora flexuosa]GGM79708.1 amidase [Thermopolyspora flexuosa]
MPQIHELSALELAAAVRSRVLSPVEIAEHYLGRVAALNATTGAYVTVTAELALRQARRAERLVLQAASPDELPPLLGVPVPVQDLTPVKGVRLTLGSAAYRELVAPVDDPVVVRLREAGTVLLGKTTTSEFGLACFTESDVAPPARNPWAPGRSAGGAAGGAAVAASAGLAPVAHGVDGLGAVRVAASACGVVGVKPSRGRVPAGIFTPDPFGLTVPGVVARTVADAAALLDVLSGGGEGPEWTAPRDGTSFLDCVARDPGRLRIGVTAVSPVPGVTPDPEVRAAFERTCRLLESLGHELVETAPVLGPEGDRILDVLWFTMARLHTVRAAHARELRPLTSWLRGMGRLAAGLEVVRAHAELDRAMRDAMLCQEAAVDVVLTPTLAQQPPPIGWFTDGVGPAETFARMKAFSPFAAEANLTGRPSVTLPLYWSAEGLPIGMMLTGRWGEEGTLLSLCAQLEASRGVAQASGLSAA